MSAAPLVPPRADAPARAVVTFALGLDWAVIPYRLAARLTDIRFPLGGGVEGRSAATGAWGDIAALGAARREPVKW